MSLSASPATRLAAISRHFTSQKPRVVVTRFLPNEPLQPLLDANLELVMWPHADKPCSQEWFYENAKGASGILCMLSEKITEELLDVAGPTLKVISTMSVGFEHADLPTLAKRNIRFGYTPDVLTDAVADITVMLALMASRNIRESMRLVDDDKVRDVGSDLSIREVIVSSSEMLTENLPTAYASSPKRVVGFLGFGRIAKATLSRLIPFGVTDVIYTTSNSSLSTSHEYEKEYPTLDSIKAVSTEQLFSDSDILFVLAPSTPQTYHIVNEARLRKMKPTSILINTGRGTLVDSAALAKALREKWIWGAGVDVVEGEPKVGIDHELVKEPRCVILPHVGSATVETRMGMAGLAVRNVLAGIQDGKMGRELDLTRYKQG